MSIFLNIHENIPNPKLTEPGIKYFLGHSLKQCHIVRERFYNQMYNMLMLFTFCLLLAGFLVYKYKGKLSEKQKKEKDIQKQKYILTKIQQVEKQKQQYRQEIITDLPHWNNNYVGI